MGSTIPRVLNLRVEDKESGAVAHTHVNVLFEINDFIKRIEDAVLSIAVLNCTQNRLEQPELNSNQLEQIVAKDNTDRVERLKAYLELDKDYNWSNSNAVVKFYNQTDYFVSLVYPVEALNGLVQAETQIWRIDMGFLLKTNASKIFLFNLIEDGNDLFILDNLSGVLKLSSDWSLPWVDLVKNSKLEAKYLIKVTATGFDFNESFNLVLTIEVNFKLKSLNTLRFSKNGVPEPKLASNVYELSVEARADSKNDLLIVNKFELYLAHVEALDPSDLFNISYAIKQLETFSYADLPFYVDASKGELYFFKSQSSKLAYYEFQVVLKLKFLYDRDVEFSLSALIKARVNQDEEMAGLKTPGEIRQVIDQAESAITNKDSIVSIDFSMPITSTDLLAYLKCPLVGLFKLKKSKSAVYKLVMPKYKRRIEISDYYPPANATDKANKKSVNAFKNKSKKPKSKKLHKVSKRSSRLDEYVFGLNIHKRDVDFEEIELLDESFYSQLYLDEHTGALYFNLGESSDLKLNIQGQQQYLYAKIAKLINFYYFERNILSKLVRVDAVLIDGAKNSTETIWANLIFKQPGVLSLFKSSPKSKQTELAEIEASLAQKNSFVVNSNNLLNLFQYGDEFLVSINIEENSPTWMALDDLEHDQSSNEGQLINIKKYFESKMDHRRNLIYRNILNELRYYYYYCFCFSSK